MTKLLYIEASPRKERSHSIAIAQAFIEAYQASHPDSTVETWDLWTEPLPEFDGDTMNAKYRIMSGETATPAEQQAWQAVVAACDRFANADAYLFSVPMWNFGVPYKLKHWIDVIAQPSLTFSVSEAGYQGLVSGKATVVYARGGDYSSEAMQAMDFQQSYMTTLLGFLGIGEVHSVIVQPTATDPDTVAQVKAQAQEQAIAIAQKF